MFKIIYAVIKKELLYAKRNLAITAAPFIIVLITLMALNISLAGEERLLQRIVPVILWVTCAFTLTLAVESSYQEELNNGVLELLAVNNNLVPFIIAKALAQSMLSLISVLLLLPILVVLFNIDWQLSLLLALIFTVTIPLFILLSTLGVGLTLLVRKGGLLLGVIILPLLLPVFVFASQALELGQLGLSMRSPLALLSAFLLVTAVFVPRVTNFSIRMSL